MDRSEILSIVTEWQNLISTTGGIKRDYENKIIEIIGSKPIKIITGFRRSGKSFLVLRILKHLVEKKLIKLENILYLNFEDFRLTPINTTEALNNIYQIFLTSLSTNGEKIIVLDEVQNISDWSKFVRTIYEKKHGKDNNIEIILTGSNSELLSSEIDSSLAGRFIEFHIQPFSFKEFLDYSGINIKTEADYFRNQDKIKKLFYEYMKYGGLPEQFSIASEKAKYSYLEGIMNKVILDDIVNRFKIKNTTLVEKVLYYLTSNIGSITSYSNITKYAKELRGEVKQDTIVNYIDYLLKSFAIIEVSKFDWKSKKVFSGSKKYYSVDLGLVNLYKGLTSNFSKQLENLILLHLTRNSEVRDIFYISNSKEIDFITMSRERTFTKYQVCQKLDEKNKQRELGAFVQADKYLEKGANIVFTLEGSDEALTYKGTQIQKRNIIKSLSL